MRAAGAILREALLSARSQPVASLVSILIVAGMVATVLLTAGRTVGAQQQVLSSIDSEGTRSIIIRADPTSGLDDSVVSRLTNVRGITWIGAFGPVQDVTNSLIPEGNKVPVRSLWTSDPTVLGVPARQALPGRTAWASSTSLDQLGMPDRVGGIATRDGVSYSVGGRLTVPSYLRFLEPLLVVPAKSSGTVAAVSSGGRSVAVLVVVAQRPDLVAPVSRTVTSLLGVTDPKTITVQTSEQFATLRALVQQQLGSSGRSLVLAVLGLTAFLVAVILYGLVMLRRKDFGRRRALGASQGFIIGLLLSQMAFLSLLGAVTGSLAAGGALLVEHEPLPSITYFVALGVLAVFVGLLAALVPAIAASRRDPLTELRVP